MLSTTSLLSAQPFVFKSSSISYIMALSHLLSLFSSLVSPANNVPSPSSAPISTPPIPHTPSSCHLPPTVLVSLRFLLVVTPLMQPRRCSTSSKRVCKPWYHHLGLRGRGTPWYAARFLFPPLRLHLTCRCISVRAIRRERPRLWTSV